MLARSLDNLKRAAVFSLQTRARDRTALTGTGLSSVMGPLRSTGGRRMNGCHICAYNSPGQ